MTWRIDYSANPLSRRMDLFQTRYIEEEIGSVIQVALDSAIGDSEYEEHRVDGWIHSVLEQCTGHLAELHKNYKFVGMSSQLFLIISL